VEMQMMALKLLAMGEVGLHLLLQAHLLQERAVAAVAHKDKLLVQAKAAVVMEQIIIILLALVLPTQVAVVEAVDMQVVMVVQVALVVQA
jgi:hypothetical protein